MEGSPDCKEKTIFVIIKSRPKNTDIEEIPRRQKKNGDKKTKFGSGEDKRAVSATLGAIF